MKKITEGELFADRYLLVEKLGVGGFSEVWKAQDTEVGALVVAVKIFAPGNGLDTKGLEVFSKEYGLVFNLNHANLLRPSYYGKCDGSPYLVMPYCKNGSVLDKIGEMSEKELAVFMQQASSALGYLHDQETPIIHQDIKPDNFLIDDKGNYLLADFGISSRIRRTLTKSMGDRVSTGTLSYMPPEKFIADKQIIKAGDIFSLGVTLYELLTGDLPFGEHGGLTLKAGADVPNLPKSFSVGLNKILRACMAMSPAERPSAEELENIAGSYLKTENWPNIGGSEIESEVKQKPEPVLHGRPTVEIPVKDNKQPKPKIKSRTPDISKDKKTVAMPSDQSSLPNLQSVPAVRKKRRWLVWVIIAGVLTLTGVAIGLIMLTSEETPFVNYFNQMVDNDSPEAVAEDYVNHINKKEWDEAKKLGTEQTGQMVDMFRSFADMGGQQAAEKKDLRVEGMKCDTQDDKSTCTYTQEGKQEKVDLVKKDGKWLVDMKKESGEPDTPPSADSTAK